MDTSVLYEVLNTSAISADERLQRQATIHESLSAGMGPGRNGAMPNIQERHLRELFDAYDEWFFENSFIDLLNEHRLSFRMSRRMSRAGGTTTRLTDRRTGRTTFEIAIAERLVVQTFADAEGPVYVTGLACRNALEAVQRILEHEIIHLSEMLVWQTSNCRQRRFQGLARDFFGHTQHHHELQTPRERAARRFGISPGTRVTFEFENVRHTGIVNRVTHRASVLVPDRNGETYSDGRRYVKYYVPLELLRPIG